MGLAVVVVLFQGLPGFKLLSYIEANGNGFFVFVLIKGAHGRQQT
jgi:hypothetical protein